jgi:hypothetical protein
MNEHVHLGALGLQLQVQADSLLNNSRFNGDTGPKINNPMLVRNYNGQAPSAMASAAMVQTSQAISNLQLASLQASLQAPRPAVSMSFQQPQQQRINDMALLQNGGLPNGLPNGLSASDLAVLRSLQASSQAPASQAMGNGGLDPLLQAKLAGLKDIHCFPDPVVGLGWVQPPVFYDVGDVETDPVEGAEARGGVKDGEELTP